MKIVFMGTPDFTVPILDSIYSAGHEIALVVSQPDREKGRKHILTSPPAVDWAKAHDIPVFQPEKVRQEDAVDTLRKVGADIFIVAAYGQILPKEILEMPRFGCVNVHASLLPLYRGAAPIQWAILDGRETTGVTIMQMGEGLDDGDILLQKEIPIEPEDTGGSLFDKLAHLGGAAIIEAISLIETGQITPVPQEDSKATKVGKIDKALGKLDISRDAAELVRYVRGLSPWPGCTIGFRGKDLKIIEAEAITEQEYAECGNFDMDGLHEEPGTTVVAAKDVWLIRAGEGFFCPKRVQMPGKRAVSIEEFLNGNHIDPKEKLS